MNAAKDEWVVEDYYMEDTLKCTEGMTGHGKH
jgi:hypothetical protein